jgi:mRNA-degrading endonuclease RelE of RelBE toxin-antitoxin system
LSKIKEQLIHEPTKQTKNKKPLPGLKPPWVSREPVWELRVGKFRVYYDVDEEQSLVAIKAIREKPPHLTTEDTL